MAYQETKNFLAKVSTTSGGTFATIKGLTDFNDSADTDDTEIPVFAEADPLTFTSKNARTWDGSGVRDPADTTGQNVIRDAYESQDTIYVQSLEDGTAGKQYPVRVINWSVSRSREDNVMRFSFNLKQNGAATTVAP